MRKATSTASVSGCPLMRALEFRGVAGGLTETTQHCTNDTLLLPDLVGFFTNMYPCPPRSTRRSSAYRV